MKLWIAKTLIVTKKFPVNGHLIKSMHLPFLLSTHWINNWINNRIFILPRRQISQALTVTAWVHHQRKFIFFLFLFSISNKSFKKKLRLSQASIYRTFSTLCSGRAPSQATTKFCFFSKICSLFWNSTLLITKMSISSNLDQNCGSPLLAKIIYVVKFSDFWLLKNFHNFGLNCLKLTQS